MRELHIGLATALLLLPMQALALGLGQMRVHSALNQPLDVSIPLLGAGGDEERIRAELASPGAFRDFNLPYPGGASQLRVTVEGGAVRVTSGKPMREPILDLVIEITGPDGRLMREFSVLLDPPKSVYRLPESAATAGAEPPRLPREQVTRRKPPRDAPQVALDGNYQVRRGDTLNRIARQFGSSPDLSTRRMEDALIAANPEAFIDGDPDRLRAGAVLKVPAADGARVAAADRTPAAAAKEGSVEAPAAAEAQAPSQGGRLSIAPPPRESAEEVVRRSTAVNEELREQNEALRGQLNAMDEKLNLLTTRVLELVAEQQRRQGPPGAAAPGRADRSAPAQYSGREGGVEPVAARPAPAASHEPAPDRAVVVEPVTPVGEGRSAALPWAAGAVAVFGLAAIGFVGWRRRQTEEYPHYSAHWDE